MRRTISVTAASILISIGALGDAVCVPAQDSEAIRQLRSFPRSDALDYIIHTHQDQGFRPFGYDFPPNKRAETAKPPLIVYTTWFLRGESGIAVQYTVDAFGRVNTVRSCYNWAEQGCQQSQATPAQISRLRRDIYALPASSAPPSLKRLLVVSFYRDQRWTTRLYDRARLPMQVRNLYEITGLNPFEQPEPVTADR